MQTFKQIVDLFDAACTAHLGVNTFYYGTLDKLDATSQNVNYNYVFLRPLSSPGIVTNPNGLTGTRNLAFELYSLDVPKLTETDYLTVMSNTEQVIYDILSYFNNGSNQQTLYTTLSTITPVNEAFNDRVYGWVATVNVINEGILNYCNFPS
jgi:hypothetical protein